MKRGKGKLQNFIRLYPTMSWEHLPLFSFFFVSPPEYSLLISISEEWCKEINLICNLQICRIRYGYLNTQFLVDLLPAMESVEFESVPCTVPILLV
jgi:hypothetical protein